MKQYTHIFFDLDHTIWDFESNAKDTLKELYGIYALAEKGDFTPEDFIATYKAVNRQMWQLYEQGKMDKQTLREKRFHDSLSQLGVKDEDIPEHIWDDYLRICPEKTILMPNAVETLDYLVDKYPMTIITNGFQQTQERKLISSDLDKYFKSMVTSESVGYQKPDRRIFEHALKQSGSTIQQTIMIGDSHNTDIQGARNMGLDHVWYNPHKMEHNYTVMHEIGSLLELKELL